MKLDIPEKLRDRVEPRRALPGFVIAPTEKIATRELARIAKAYAKKRYGREESPRDVFEAGLADLPGTLAQAQTSVAKLSSFSRLATPVVSNLRVAANYLAFGTWQPFASGSAPVSPRSLCFISIPDRPISDPSLQSSRRVGTPWCCIKK